MDMNKEINTTNKFNYQYIFDDIVLVGRIARLVGDFLFENDLYANENLVSIASYLFAYYDFNRNDLQLTDSMKEYIKSVSQKSLYNISNKKKGEK